VGDEHENMNMKSGQLDAILLLMNLTIPRLNLGVLFKFLSQLRQIIVVIFNHTNDETIKKYCIAILS